MGQDLTYEIKDLNPEEANAWLVLSALVGIEREEAKVIRRYIASLLSSNPSAEELKEFWLKSPADIYFYQGEQVERFLRSLSDRLAQPPYQET